MYVGVECHVGDVADVNDECGVGDVSDECIVDDKRCDVHR